MTHVRWQAKSDLAAAEAGLKEKQDALAAVEQKLKELEEKQNATLAEKKRLQEESDLCTGRLERAGKLTAALGSEKIRWKENVGILNEQINDCVGSVFLAAAFIGYPPAGGVAREFATPFSGLAALGFIAFIALPLSGSAALAVIAFMALA